MDSRGPDGVGTRRATSRRAPDGDGAVLFADAVLASPSTPSSPSSAGRGDLSVVVPTHDDGPNIGALLLRLLAEPDVAEVLVVASGCGDETVPTVLEIAERGEGRVRVYVEAERSGKAAAVNFGLSEVTRPYAVIVSGDVLPERGALGRVLDALRRPGVGLAGGRPVPVNPDATATGHAVQLLWRLHDRLSRHQPKLGELLGVRMEAVVALPRTSVDEACFQALLESAGWRSVYVPDARVLNRGPGGPRDFVAQRRQIHAGHLWLRRRHGYTVPSLRVGLVVAELVRDLRRQPGELRPRRLWHTAAAVTMEAWARALARVDYARGRENHVWPMVTSAKAPAHGPHWDGGGRGGRVAGARLAPPAPGEPDGERELPVQLPVRDVQRLRAEGGGAHH